MSAAAAQCLGVDIGGTHLRIASVDGEGNLLQAERYMLDDRSPEALLNLIKKGRMALGMTESKLPMGIGLAGQIWLATGVVAVGPNLGWFDVPFGTMLKDAFGSVRLINDLNAITVGEAVRGAGQGSGDVVCVFVGTGVGMGAVIGGRVIEGADGLATELGHTKVASVRDGRQCGCGERGCLEAYTSGRHLPELFAEKVKAGKASPLFERLQGDLSKLDAAGIDAAYAAQDPAAMALWEDIGELLARSIGDMVTVFNPRVLVLGGGVLVHGKELKKLVIGRIGDHAARPAQKKLKVCNTVLGDDAGIVGAALTARHST